MSLLKYILRSIYYFRKKNLAIMAGTALSTAVLTGALIIGDSVDQSLKKLVDIRLGEVRYALTSADRFFKTELEGQMQQDIKTPVIAILQSTGIAINQEKQTRINHVNILGVHESFQKASSNPIPIPNKEEAVINEYVAQKLDLSQGDNILLRINALDKIPVNAPFAKDKNPSIALRLTIKAIASNAEMGRFSLKSNQSATANIFVNHDLLGEKLDIDGFSNVILVCKANSPMDTAALQNSLVQNWSIDDIALEINNLQDRSVLEVSSKRIFIDDQIANNLEKINGEKEKVLTYLVNAFRFQDKETPYSFATAASPPLVPSDLKKNEAVINSWLADDLGASIGDTITFEYFSIGPLKKLIEESNSFIVRDIISTNNSIINSSLMPEYPGLADAGSCSEWDAGVPIDLEKIRDKDEAYWNTYRGTPKALISIEAGEEIWENRYGSATAFRFMDKNLSDEDLEALIMEKMKPGDVKFIFFPVYEQGALAAKNSIDFGGLFLSLSFFVIAAGILLTILLHALNIESRKQENGILASLGFTKKQITITRIGESAFITAAGAILGVFMGIAYNYALMAGINQVWYDIVRTQMIEVYIKPTTLLLGALVGMFISLASIYWVTRRKLREPVISQIRGLGFFRVQLTKYKPARSYIIFILSLAVSVFLTVYSIITDVDKNAALFLAAGAFMLIALVAIMNIFLVNKVKRSKNALPGIFSLAQKNAARNKSRSITTVVLLALGTFSIIITGANRKTFHGADNRRNSGAGGFLYWAETTIPLPYDLNTQEGKEKLALQDEQILKDVSFVHLYAKEGDDASCLNLNQVSNPQVLGVDPAAFDSVSAFAFKKLHKKINSKHPWLSLNKTYSKNIIPAIADQTVLTWGLKKSVGDTLHYINEKGENLKLLLVGGLSSSVFQGNVLISDSLFLKHFPSEAGSDFMLINGKKSRQDEIADVLRFNLTDYGIELTPAIQRLREFYSVTNTYLSVFMLLGGLGVVIATIGLGIVLLRNILDRKKEFAVLLAHGFKKQQVFLVTFIENMFLLLTGLAVGIISAFIGILPSLLSPAFNMPWGFMLTIMAAIVASGILCIYFPARSSMPGNIVEELRND